MFIIQVKKKGKTYCYLGEYYSEKDMYGLLVQKRRILKTLGVLEELEVKHPGFLAGAKEFCRLQNQKRAQEKAQEKAQNLALQQAQEKAQKLALQQAQKSEQEKSNDETQI